jgi:hypothetical protein
MQAIQFPLFKTHLAGARNHMRSGDFRPFLEQQGQNFELIQMGGQHHLK